MPVLMLSFVLLIGTLSASANFISATPPNAVITRTPNPLDEDHCPPQTIVSTPLVITGNTAGSVHNYDASCAYTGTAPDDIYGLSLRCRGDVTVSLCGSNFDTVIEVRRGTGYGSCPGTDVMACNDDCFCCGNNLQSVVTFYTEIQY